MTDHAKALLCSVFVWDEIRRRTKAPQDQAGYESSLGKLDAYIEEMERKAQYWDDILKREAEEAKKRDFRWTF